MIVKGLDFLAHWNLAGYHASLIVAVWRYIGSDYIALPLLVLSGGMPLNHTSLVKYMNPFLQCCRCKPHRLEISPHLIGTTRGMLDAAFKMKLGDRPERTTVL